MSLPGIGAPPGGAPGIVQIGSFSLDRGTSTASFNTAYPAGIEAGDLILVYAGVEAGASRLLNTPSGYSIAASYTIASSNMRASYLFSKVADGSESGTNLNITTVSGTGNIGTIIMVFRGASMVSGATFGLASSATADPPALVSGFGAIPGVWIAATMGQGVTYTGFPAGYPDNHAKLETSAPSMAIASIVQAVASDDPDAFTKSTANAHHVITICVA